jgi:lysozyme
MPPTPLDGLDVSSIQGEIDWAAVRAAGYRWCYIRLTRGTDEVDVAAARNLAGCAAHGILPGFYHRAVPALGGPDAQALHFAVHLSRIPASLVVTLPPCLDYEDQLPGQQWSQEFITRLRGLTGRAETMLYTSGSYVDAYLGGESWMDDRLWLWIADSGKYTGATKGKPQYRTPRVVAHQYGQSTTVPGLDGHLCDVNVSIGDLIATAKRR